MNNNPEDVTAADETWEIIENYEVQSMKTRFSDN